MKTLHIFWIGLFVLASVGLVDAQEDRPLPDLPGQIAYIGADLNVYNLDPSSGDIVQLTDDAGVTDDQLLLYQWPTWARDGWLAYFGLTLGSGGNILATDVYVARDALSGELVYTGEAEAFNYAYWSPRACATGSECRDLAVLLSSAAANGLFVEMIRTTGDAAETEMIGRGSPFYYSFSPDGERMLWQRNNRRLDIYDVNESQIVDTLRQTPGEFFAPAWSPVDDRLLFGVLSPEENATDLVILANDETQTLASDLAGPVYFAWSPDGNRVAYTAQRGPIFVYDPVTDETVARSTEGGVLAFFWSPDSTSIAYVTLAQGSGSFSADADDAMQPLARLQQRDATALTWSVLDAETGATRRYSRFVPTRDMAYLLTYFDQFAHSHRIWSPDSQHIIYGETAPDDEAVISVLNVAEEATVPLFIAEGFIGIWSFE